MVLNARCTVSGFPFALDILSPGLHISIMVNSWLRRGALLKSMPAKVIEKISKPKETTEPARVIYTYPNKVFCAIISKKAFAHYEHTTSTVTAFTSLKKTLYSLFDFMIISTNQNSSESLMNDVSHIARFAKSTIINRLTT